MTPPALHLAEAIDREHQAAVGAARTAPAMSADAFPLELLTFLGLKIESNPKRATIRCQVDDASGICDGHLILLDGGDIGVVPVAPCSRGHQHGEVWDWLELRATMMAGPWEASDPLAAFLERLGKLAPAAGIDPTALRRVVKGALIDA